MVGIKILIEAFFFIVHFSCYNVGELGPFYYCFSIQNSN